MRDFFSGLLFVDGWLAACAFLMFHDDRAHPQDLGLRLKELFLHPVAGALIGLTITNVFLGRKEHVLFHVEMLGVVVFHFKITKWLFKRSEKSSIDEGVSISREQLSPQIGPLSV